MPSRRSRPISSVPERASPFCTALCLAPLAGALSPLAVLSRGFSLTTKDGVVLHDAFGLAPGDVVRTRLADGAFQARVLEVEARAEHSIDSAGEGVP